MSATPLWLQVVIPASTLVGGFALGRVTKALDRRQQRRDEAANRRPEFQVTRLTGSGYRLHNIGDTGATAIRIDSGSYPRERLMHLPEEPFNLAKDQPVDFIMSTGINMPKPAAFVVRCAELPGGVHVPVP
ncbi:MAG TPA: hypothetical protein VG674_25615 [Amycolatopsis sp.]|nr:hypothetical protein [Amycolatopsis sp.]